jgi:5-methylcytosine-specific restriction endonuclease McrA
MGFERQNTSARSVALSLLETHGPSTADGLAARMAVFSRAQIATALRGLARSGLAHRSSGEMRDGRSPAAVYSAGKPPLGGIIKTKPWCEQEKIAALVCEFGKATADDLLPQFAGKSWAQVSKAMLNAAGRGLIHRVGVLAHYGTRPTSIYSAGPGPSKSPWLVITMTICGRCGAVIAGGRCKACEAAVRRSDGYVAARQAWVAANRNHLSQYRRDRYQRSAEERRRYSREWYAANTERARAARVSWIKENAEKNRSYKRAWARRNKEYLRLKDRKRRRLIGADRLSRGILERLQKLQRGKCACCGRPLGRDFHLDHIVPLALGGRNIDANVQLLRARCNQQKGAKHPVDYMQQKGFLL